MTHFCGDDCCQLLVREGWVLSQRLDICDFCSNFAPKLVNDGMELAQSGNLWKATCAYKTLITYAFKSYLERILLFFKKRQNTLSAAQVVRDKWTRCERHDSKCEIKPQYHRKRMAPEYHCKRSTVFQGLVPKGGDCQCWEAA